MGSQIGEFKKKMKEKNVNKLVLCFKTNSGKGSTISVLILGQKNFDMVGFTNVYGGLAKVFVWSFRGFGIPPRIPRFLVPPWKNSCGQP